MEDRRLILLIDFEGHPALGDNYMNNLRFSYLNQFLFSGASGHHDEPSLIISSHHYDAHHKKTWELELMTKADGLHKWVTISPADKELDYKDIIEIAKEKDVNITDIFIAGCNTCGCVALSRGYSAVHWAKAGYNVKIMLSMCADYQVKGDSTIEKNIVAFARLYEIIKWHSVVDEIDILYEPTWAYNEIEFLMTEYQKADLKHQQGDVSFLPKDDKQYERPQ